MAEGRINPAIARQLVVSDKAVEKHVGNIFSKLDLPPTDRRPPPRAGGSAMGEGMTVTERTRDRSPHPDGPHQPAHRATTGTSTADATRPGVAGSARAVWIALGGILAIAALAGARTASSASSPTRSTRNVRPSRATTSRRWTVSNESGSVTITATPGDTVTVVAKVSDGWQATDMSMQVVDGVLELHADCPAFVSPWCNVDYTVAIPADRPVTVDGSGRCSGARDDRHPSTSTATTGASNSTTSAATSGCRTTTAASSDGDSTASTSMRGTRTAGSSCRSSIRRSRCRRAPRTAASRSSSPTPRCSTASTCTPTTAAPTTSCAPTPTSDHVIELSSRERLRHPPPPG